MDNLGYWRSLDGEEEPLEGWWWLHVLKLLSRHLYLDRFIAIFALYMRCCVLIHQCLDNLEYY